MTPRSLQRVAPELWAPDAHFTCSDGSSSTIPTAVFVTVFAFLGTWIVARRCFREPKG